MSLFRISLYILIVFGFNRSSAQQIPWVTKAFPTVLMDGGSLDNPWTGGMDAAQFSLIQLDQDQALELVVFDRVTGDFTTFDHVNGAWSHTDFNLTWPTAQHFALFRDYNGDGLEDCFTYGDLGFAVWRHLPDHSFELASALLTYAKGANQVNIPVNPGDIPAIADVDSDGDVDILTFGVSGLNVELYSNLSMDSLGHADSLLFERTTACFGQFVESSSSDTLTLGTCQDNGNLKTLHTGSTLCWADFDQDGQQDLLVGDVSSTKLSALRIVKNDGAYVADSLWYPFEGQPLPQFPAVFTLDSTLVICTNATTAVDNVDHVQHAAFSDLNLQTGLIPGVLDHGSVANATFVDYNNDGLHDLVLSGLGRYTGTNYQSGLALLINTGTNINPTYTIQTTDLAGLEGLNKSGLHPTFADLDADDDLDIVFGSSTGELIYAEQQNPGEYVLTDNYAGVDVGSFSTPAFADLNDDGLLDLLVGEEKGNLNLMTNQGTVTTPLFEATPQSTSFGNIDTDLNCCAGYSSPGFSAENGQTFLITGSEKGQAWVYDLETLVRKQVLPLSNGRMNLAVDGENGWMVVGTAAGGWRFYAFDNSALSVGNSPVGQGPISGVWMDASGKRMPPNFEITQAPGGLYFRQRPGGRVEKRVILKSR